MSNYFVAWLVATLWVMVAMLQPGTSADAKLIAVAILMTGWAMTWRMK